MEEGGIAQTHLGSGAETSQVQDIIIPGTFYEVSADAEPVVSVLQVDDEAGNLLTQALCEAASAAITSARSVEAEVEADTNEVQMLLIGAYRKSRRIMATIVFSVKVVWELI